MTQTLEEKGLLARSSLSHDLQHQVYTTLKPRLEAKNLRAIQLIELSSLTHWKQYTMLCKQNITKES